MVVTEYEYELLKESPPFFSPTVAVYDPMTVQVSLLRQYNLQQSLKVNDFSAAIEKVVRWVYKEHGPELGVRKSVKSKVTDNCYTT